MIRIYAVLMLLVLGCLETFAQSELKISGKLRLLKPVEIALKTIDGKVLLSTTAKNGEEFSMGALKIKPDVYLICFDKTSQPIYLTNTDVTVKGFYDVQNVGNRFFGFYRN